jgi:hypothetical protein
MLIVISFQLKNLCQRTIYINVIGHQWSERMRNARA